MEISSKSIISAWSNAMEYVSREGEWSGSGGKRAIEVLNLAINIKNPELGFAEPIDQLKHFNFIYPTHDEIASFFFSKETKLLHNYSYGARIFNYNGFRNQVDDFIIPLLKSSPQTRKAMISIYDPAKDSSIENTETPGIVTIFFKIIQGKLNITVIIRSSELLIGWPANIYQTRLLQEYISGKLVVKCGDITTISHSTHINEQNLPDALQMVKKIKNNF